MAYAGTAVLYGAGLVAAPYFIHELGASAYGVAALLDVFTIAGWVSLLDLGIQSSATRHSAEAAARDDWEEVSRIISTTVALFLLVASVLALALLLAAGWLAHEAFKIPSQFEDDLFLTLQVLALALAIQFPGLAIAAAVEGTQRNDILTIVRTIVTLAGTAVAVLLVASGHGLVAYMLVVVCAPVVGVLVLTAWLLRARRTIRIRPRLVNRATLRRLVPLSRQIFVARVAVLALLQTDRIVIGTLLSAAALTSYAIAAKIYAVAFVVGALMNSAVVAATAHYQALGDRERLQELFLRGTKYALVASLPLGAAIFAMAPELCEAWVGAEFRSSGLTLQIWLTSLFVPVMTGVASLMLMGLDRMGPTGPLWAGAAVLNLAVTIPGALLWGVNGVVLGSTLAYLAVGPPFLRYALRTLEVSWNRFFARAVGPTLPWIAAAGMISFGGVTLLPVERLPYMLLVLLAAEVLAVAGFVWRLAPSERVSLMRGSALAPSG